MKTAGIDIDEHRKENKIANLKYEIDPFENDRNVLCRMGRVKTILISALPEQNTG